MLGVGRDGDLVRPDRYPLLALLELVDARVVGLVADVDDVAVPAVVDPGVAVQHVLDVVRRVAAQQRLLVDQGLLRRLQLVLLERVQVVAVLVVGHPDGFLEVVEHVDLALGVLSEQIVPGPGHVADPVLAPDDSGGVHPVRHRVRRAGVVDGVVEELEDLVVVLQLLVVDLQQLVGSHEPRRDGLVGEDHVVAVARAQLRQHRRHRVEVRLPDLDVVLLLELLDQLRVQVLGPVEVHEVAVDLRLHDLLCVLLRAAARVADPAAGEAHAECQAGTATQQPRRSMRPAR